MNNLEKLNYISKKEIGEDLWKYLGRVFLDDVLVSTVFSAYCSDEKCLQKLNEQ